MLPHTAAVWERVQRVSQLLCATYGYGPIYTPIFEHTEVFTRGIGEATDIVSKEMYTFLDRAGRSLTLRPEGTASVVRAVREHSLVPPGTVGKFYYAGPMFRYERPQKGRMRQFWQVGVEVLGAAGPSADAEVIVLLWRLFEELGIPAANMRLLINSMGDEACRPAYREAVAAYILENIDSMCEECARRAEVNPLRSFDCKNTGCKEVMAGAPLLRDSLCDECAAHYSAVKEALVAVGIPYVEDPTLVRGLDYYTRTVFEIQADGLGAQNAIGGGGRYDRLMETLGGPPTPGLGWALGFERALLAMEAAGKVSETRTGVRVYVVQVDPSVSGAAFQTVQALRDAGVATEMDHAGRSVRAQFKQADKAGARFAVVLGPDEISEGVATVRDMKSGEEERVALPELPGRLSRKMD